MGDASVKLLTALTALTPSEHTLEARHIAVLQYSANGKTNTEIRMLTGLSENSIQKHITQAMDRLGAPSRTAAVAIALRRGLIR